MTNKKLFYHNLYLSDEKVLRGTLLQFCNCKVLRNGKLTEEDFWVQDGQILNPEPIFFDQKRFADIQIDCNNFIIAPGLIDIQINGAFGVDFSTSCSDFADNLKDVRRKLLRYGVTSFCPTLISSKPSLYKKVLQKLKRSDAGSSGAEIIGAHLEGPVINQEKRGAHPSQNLINGFSSEESGLDELKDIYGEDFTDYTAIVTLAPELPNVLPVVKELTEHYNVKVSLGHSKASVSQGEQAVSCGASGITHLFNAMLPFHHRDPGLVGLLASKYLPTNRTLFYGVIADGIHTHDSALRIAHRTHPQGLVLITDAIAALGLKDGIHLMGDVEMSVEGNKAVIVGTDTLAGSVSSLDACVRHLVKAARCSEIEALECASLHPAQFLDIQDKKGTLNFGTDADFVLFDEKLNAKATFISGQLVWSSENSYSC